MDLMSLVAKLTLDSSEYLKGLEDAKKAAEEIGAEIKKTTDKAKKETKSSGGSGRKGGKPKETAKNTADPTETFFKYIVEHNEEVTSVTSALETAAKAFGEASKGTEAEGVGAFVKYLAEHSSDLNTTAGKIETLASALSSALKTSDNPMATGAYTFIDYIVAHKEDLGTASGNIWTIAGALGQALQTSDDPLATGAGKFLEYMVTHKDDLSTVGGVITTLAGALGTAMSGSDNEGVALAGDFLSYMAQNAANLTNPVGVVMTLLVYLVENWATISAFFSSVAPAWLLELPANLSEAWTSVMNAIQGAIDKLREYFAARQSDLASSDPMNDGSDDWFQYNPTDSSSHYNAAGLDYVPRNGYRSILHEGEAVLNKRDAETWRLGGNPGASASDIAAAVYSVFEGMSVVMDGNQVGRLTAKTVGREMERTARAGRFATA